MDKENENIIGMEYVPYDNSWCINIGTGNYDYIVSDSEQNAKFIIISLPFEQEVKCLNNIIKPTFVIVKSDKTGNIYRALYKESSIVKTNIDKEIKITPPEGYEIDKENSTFDCIKFKKKEQKPWRYDESQIINGYYISSNSGTVVSSNWRGSEIYNTEYNYNIFATEKQAKSALAVARISQIMANDKRFGGVVTDEKWNNQYIIKYVITRNCGHIFKSNPTFSYNFLAFHTSEQRDLFLKENEDLVKDYLMID